MNPPLHQILVSRLVGGAAVIAIRLSSAAKARGFDCTAWVPGPGGGPADTALATEQVRRRYYDFEGLRGGRAQHLAACARMVPGFLGTTRPLVHVQNPTVFGLMRPALSMGRARWIVHFHIEPSADEIAWTLKSPPEHIVTCAKYIAVRVRQAASNRATPVPVTTVPNAVDTDKFTPGDPAAARDRLGLRTDRFVVLMLANLAHHKGQATTLRAVAELVKRRLAVECWLVGEDRVEGKAYEQELHALVNTHGLANHVRFLGFRQDAPELLRAADAFVLPSTHEGLPLSVLEAQAAGVPVIGSNIPGIMEVVSDGATGFIVPPDDIVGYADRLQLLLQDRGRRQQIVVAASAHVMRDHRWSTMEDRMFSVYQALSDR